MRNLSAAQCFAHGQRQSWDLVRNCLSAGRLFSWGLRVGGIQWFKTLNPSISLDYYQLSESWEIALCEDSSLEFAWPLYVCHVSMTLLGVLWEMLQENGVLGLLLMLQVFKYPGILFTSGGKSGQMDWWSICIIYSDFMRSELSLEAKLSIWLVSLISELYLCPWANGSNWKTLMPAWTHTYRPVIPVVRLCCDTRVATFL